MIISRILFLLLSASCLFFGQPVLAANISKCQDADGKWHYGDFAADACAQSKVEKINQKGQKIGEQKAPIPEEERQKRALEKKLAAEKKAAEKIQRIKDKRLLSVYESPEAIEKARDSRVKAIKGMIQTNAEFVKYLKKRLQDTKKRLKKANEQEKKKLQNSLRSLDGQIAELEQSNSELDEQRINVVNRYNADLTRYLEIIGQ